MEGGGSYPRVEKRRLNSFYFLRENCPKKGTKKKRGDGTVHVIGRDARFLCDQEGNCFCWS